MSCAVNEGLSSIQDAGYRPLQKEGFAVIATSGGALAITVRLYCDRFII